MTLLVHESFASGARTSVELAARGDHEPGVCVVVDGAAVVGGELALEHVVAVFRRYGKPLDPTVELRGASLAIGDGASITRLRHLAVYDVIAKDYLVLAAPGLDEPLCDLATSISAALAHLARRIAELADAATS